MQVHWYYLPPSVLAVKQLDSIMESDDDDAFLYGDEESAGGEGQVKQEQLAGAPYQGEHRTVLCQTCHCGVS